MIQINYNNIINIIVIILRYTRGNLRPAITCVLCKLAHSLDGSDVPDLGLLVLLRKSVLSLL